MADAYLRWKYGHSVDPEPPNHQRSSPLPTNDRLEDADAPLPGGSPGGDPTYTSVNDTPPNTTPSADTDAHAGNATVNDIPDGAAPTIDPPTDDVPTTDLPANDLSTNNPSAHACNVPPHLPGSTEGSTRGNGVTLDGVDVEIAVVDIYTLSTSVKFSPTDEETTASALADVGFIGNAPFKPSMAVSMKTLKLYRILRRRKPSFSIEAFVKVISDLYLVRLPLRRYSMSNLTCK